MSEARVVIIGGGFGGLEVARGLRRAALAVTLVDRRNFHLFQPLLYQVATGGLSPANIAAPLRGLLRRQKNAEVLLGEAVALDAPARRLLLADGELVYDTLVLAAGSRPSYFGHDDWQEHAPGLKSIEDATAIRRRVLEAFEEAERQPDPAARAACLTFVVVGGGPTGVELAGSLAELARHTLRHDYRHIDPAEARILLVDAAPDVLPPYPERLRRRARRSLERLGVTVWTGRTVVDIGAGHVVIGKDDDAPERLESRTILWAAGVRAAALADVVARATGCEQDRAGRLLVNPDLTLPGHPEIFAIGDLAHVVGPDGKPLPGVAPVAIQQGRHVARVIRARQRPGSEPAPDFRYRDRGDLATIGRSAAVARLGRLQFSGLPAWLLWVVVHIAQLVAFENRILVLIQWAWNYLTFNRSARLITATDAGSYRPPGEKPTVTVKGIDRG